MTCHSSELGNASDWLKICFVKHYLVLPRADLGGDCKGCAPPPPPRDDLRFSNTTGILQKKTMWFIAVEVEQETSAPPPKKSWIRPLLLHFFNVNKENWEKKTTSYLTNGFRFHIDIYFIFSTISRGYKTRKNETTNYISHQRWKVCSDQRSLGFRVAHCHACD